MDDNDIELIKHLKAQPVAYSIALSRDEDCCATISSARAQGVLGYAPNKLSIGLITDGIAKELHEAISLGGESVKKTLHVTYTDPNQLEVMDALVDMCVAYIGEEVTAILRKHSNIF